MPEKKYSKEILKTGFVLEYKVSELLRQAGWTVISNKYYEDDFEGSVREIDLLAYKVKKVKDIDVYTTLLISCKKSDSDAWALLARKINLKDPNADWWPLHVWSNDKAIEFELLKSTTAKSFHREAIRHGVKDALSTPEYEVFAFQEMNRMSGAPKNDKNIHAALTSLMKAQAYELGALPRRKKKPSVYQFNLISLIDSDLIRLVINGNDISEESVDAENYISRYIIKKMETASRIRFITYKSFGEKIDDYNLIHEFNSDWCRDSVNSFYDDILKDASRSNILLEDFQSKAWRVIRFGLMGQGSISFEKRDITVGWSKEANLVAVKLVCTESDGNRVSSSSKIKSNISIELKNIFKYEGDFIFEIDEFPF